MPQWLDTKVLRDHGLLLSIDQIVFFDEMHRKQRSGLAALVSHQIRFRREKQSGCLIHTLECDDYDEEDVEVQEEATEANFKFPKEARMCFGVATVQKVVGGTFVREGRRCGAFNYSEHRIIDMRVQHEKRS